MMQSMFDIFSCSHWNKNQSTNAKCVMDDRKLDNLTLLLQDRASEGQINTQKKQKLLFLYHLKKISENEKLKMKPDLEAEDAEHE